VQSNIQTIIFLSVRLYFNKLLFFICVKLSKSSFLYVVMFGNEIFCVCMFKFYLTYFMTAC
jgi:hypothetical protein